MIDPILKLNSTVRDAILCICELGWLYGKVIHYLKGIFDVSSVKAIDMKGLVVQAFGFALQVLL